MWNGNFKTAIASLRLSKWRTLLTMLGIVIGISSVVTVVSLGEGLKHRIVSQINQLGSEVITVRPGKLVKSGESNEATSINFLAFFNPSTLTEKDVKELKNLPSIDAVVPVDFVTSGVKTETRQLDNIFVGGTTPDLVKVLNQKVEFGTFFEEDKEDSNFTVIGSHVAQNLFGELNPVGQSLDIEGEQFTVRGVLSPSSGGLLSLAETDFNSAVFIPMTPAVQLTEGRTNILQILLKSKDANNLDATVAEVKKTLMTTHGGHENFTVLKQYELLNIASGVLNIITGFISGIAAISLLVGGIGIMDIMLVSVSERTREIGIRKALGATNRQIRNQFLIEGLVLTISGGIIGILVSLGINLLLRIYTNFQPVITWPVVALAVSVSVIVGIIFSVAPALKAASKDPIDALRGE